MLIHGAARRRAAAEQAKHKAVVAAEQSTLPRTPQATVAETEAYHESSVRTSAAEGHIEQTLANNASRPSTPCSATSPRLPTTVACMSRARDSCTVPASE
uniref:hypothetical protein n=1 Tax=Streptomyces virginiae TaxID=1961 RepID=UPI002F90A444